MEIDKSLRSYVSQMIFALDITDAYKVALTYISTLPNGWFGSAENMARKIRQSKRTVNRAIASLKSNNLLINDTGSGRDTYYLNWTEIEKRFYEYQKENPSYQSDLAFSFGSDKEGLDQSDKNNTTKNTCGKVSGKTVGSFSMSSDNSGQIVPEEGQNVPNSGQIVTHIYKDINKEDIQNIYIKKKIQKEKDYIVTYDENGEIIDSQFSPEAEKEFLSGIAQLRQEYLESLKAEVLSRAEAASSLAQADPEDLPKSYRKQMSSNQALIQQGGKSSGTKLSARKLSETKSYSYKSTRGGRLSTVNSQAQLPKTSKKPRTRSPGQTMPFCSGSEFFSQFFAENPSVLAKWRADAKKRSLLIQMGYAA